jgi:hypothetical protein
MDIILTLLQQFLRRRAKTVLRGGQPVHLASNVTVNHLFTEADRLPASVNKKTRRAQSQAHPGPGVEHIRRCPRRARARARAAAQIRR